MKKYISLLFIVFAFVIAGEAQSNIEALLKNSDDFAISNELPAAIAEMSKVIALKPNEAVYYLKRADLYFGVPDYKMVLQDVKKAVALAPNDKPTVLTAARYLRNIRECGESLNIINDYLSRQPDADDVIYARSHSKMCLGDWLGAYEDMSRAVQLAPDNSHYRTSQIGLLSKIGYKELSADQFEQFLNILKTNYEQTSAKNGRADIGRQIAEVYSVRAGTHHAKKDEAAEFADLEEFIKYYPKDFSYRRRGRIYADHNLFDKAVADFTKAIELSPKDPFFLLDRADVYVEAGKLDEALKDYDAVVKLDDTLTEVVETKKKYAVTMLSKKK